MKAYKVFHGRANGKRLRSIRELPLREVGVGTFQYFGEYLSEGCGEV